MKTLLLVPSGTSVTLGTEPLDKLVVAESQARPFLENIAQKGAFERIEGEIGVDGDQDQLRSLFRVLFAGLNDLGKVQISMRVVDAEQIDRDKVHSFLKVVGF